MEIVAVMVVLSLLVLPVVGVILGAFALRRTMQLKAEMRSLGERVDQVLEKRRPPTPSPEAPAAVAPPPAPAPAAPATPPTAGSPPSPPAPCRPKPRRAPVDPEWLPGGKAVSEGQSLAGLRERWGQRLGAQLPVWLGAIAVALAGVFLVHYSLQRELITPALRVALGLAAGVICLAVGEFLARKQELIAHALSAAGIATLFAALVAGVTLYHLIPPAPGFGLIVLTTLGGVALSLRRGPMVALIGLLGGFVTPALIGAEEPNPIPLFAFFLVLEVGLFVVIRRRGWWLLGALASGGGLLWAALWMAFRVDAIDRGVLGVFLLALLGAAFWLVRGPSESGAAPSRLAAVRPQAITAASAVTGAVLLGALASRAGYGVMEWAFLGVLGAGLLLVGRLDERYRLLPWVSQGANLVLFLSWGAHLPSDHLSRFLATLVASGALYALGGYGAHFRDKKAPMWASLAVVAVLGHFLLGWSLVGDQAGKHAWGITAVALALLTTLAALPHLRRRGAELALEPALEQVLAALLVGATALISLAVPLELERAFITVAWALEVLMLAWLAGQLRVPALRWLSAALALAVVMRLLLNPFVFTYPLGEHPLLSWLHYGYGLPALALAATCRVYLGQGQTRLARWMQWGAVAVGWAYLGLSIRHYFSPGDLLGAVTELSEVGSYGVVWMLYGALLLLAGEKTERRELAADGRVLFYGSVAFVILVPGLLANPLWSGLAVGSVPVFNALSFALGLPTAGVLFAARRVAPGRKGFALATLCAGLWLVFLTVSLEIRQFFHGSQLGRGATTNSELYAYSVAWVLLGVGLLVVGIWRKSATLRTAALPMMVAAVVKVFLFDFAHLGGLYRVFSFLGLGLSLFAFYYLHRRFLSQEEE